MAREKKSKKGEEEQVNPENEERKRLKKLAFSRKNLSQAAATVFNPLSPSETVTKHHGTDIVKKSQRKNRYLFSFSGLIAPISGGRIGELTNLASKNPILYLDFPQGRMKLLGTIVYPKNKYLTLQFSRSGNKVDCEDFFDTMIVFSDAYWVGKKDANPEEARLEFPKELHEEKQSELSFQGGAGATSMKRKDGKSSNHVEKVVATTVEEESLTESPVDAMESESPVRQDNFKVAEYTTPVRHSARMAGKSFKFTEVSSGDDSPESPDEMSEEADDGSPKSDESPGALESAIDVCSSEDIQQSTVQAPVSGEKESSRSSLVQATISTLFKKVEQKNTTGSSETASKKDVNTQLGGSKSKIKNVKAIKITTKEHVSLDGSGKRSGRMKRKAEAEDDIEEFSDASEDTVDSDDSYKV